MVFFLERWRLYYFCPFSIVVPPPPKGVVRSMRYLSVVLNSIGGRLQVCGRVVGKNVTPTSAPNGFGRFVKETEALESGFSRQPHPSPLFAVCFPHASLLNSGWASGRRSLANENVFLACFCWNHILRMMHFLTPPTFLSFPHPPETPFRARLLKSIPSPCFFAPSPHVFTRVTGSDSAKAIYPPPLPNRHHAPFLLKFNKRSFRP